MSIWWHRRSWRLWCHLWPSYPSALVGWLSGPIAVLTTNKVEMNVGFTVDRQLEQGQYFNRRREIKTKRMQCTMTQCREGPDLVRPWTGSAEFWYYLLRRWVFEQTTVTTGHIKCSIPEITECIVLQGSLLDFHSNVR